MKRALLSLILLGTGGCSSAETSSGNTTGGTANGGNTATNTAGTAGTAGSATTGSGGTAGSPQGGAAGAVSGGTGGASTSGAGGTSAGNGGSGGTSGGASGAAGNAGAGGAPVELPPFSFFVASIEAMHMLSGNEKGFGGDLRFGQADGLSGADEICRQTAEMGMEGAGQKEWRAFLSTTAGGTNDGPVHAIDRIGEGPWYDRLGRLVAMNKTDLAQPRPVGAHEVIVDDLPNEHGIPNGYPVPGGPRVDNHHVLTGSDAQGMLYSTNMGDTCNDWTSSEGGTGIPRCGASWPRSEGDSWISYRDPGGCAPGYNLVEGADPSPEDALAVGSYGGYGAIYCFSLTP
ncbi:MAG TPA: hypothetical protein VHO25_15455 [Polyangiaceae bacterium]|nr:hypothetical protein [Polyangiaceae bacterium]